MNFLEFVASLFRTLVSWPTVFFIVLWVTRKQIPDLVRAVIDFVNRVRQFQGPGGFSGTLDELGRDFEKARKLGEKEKVPPQVLEKLGEAADHTATARSIWHTVADQDGYSYELTLEKRGPKKAAPKKSAAKKSSPDEADEKDSD